VVLTTTVHQEVYTYLRPSWPAYDADGKIIIHPELVPDLDPGLGSEYPTYPLYRPEPPATSARLPNIRPGVLYVFGDKSSASPKDLQKHKLETTGNGVGGSGGVKQGRVKGVSHPDYGHLIPMEVPGFCARVAAEWASRELGRWRNEDDEYAQWTKKPLDEKLGFSDDFRKHTGEPPRRNKNTKAKI
jgi:hypothetical protein